MVVAKRKGTKSSQNKAKDVEGVKKELSIMDRVGMASLLPTEGNMLTQITARDIRKKVELTQEDIKKHNVKSRPGGGLSWDDNGKKKIIRFTNPEYELLRSQIDKLDAQQKITSDMLSACLVIKE